jgi:hypothetical protein
VVQDREHRRNGGSPRQGEGSSIRAGCSDHACAMRPLRTVPVRGLYAAWVLFPVLATYWSFTIPVYSFSVAVSSPEGTIFDGSRGPSC